MDLIRKPKESFSRVRFLDYYMEGHRGFIAGGCFKNIFLKQKVKDIDIFFEDEKDFLHALSFFSKNNDYKAHYENSNTVAFINIKTNIVIELIRNTYGTVENILSKFDFSITKYAYARKIDSSGVTYFNTYTDTFFEDLTNNKLVIDGELVFPIGSFERSYRYNRYGFSLCKESKAKLIEALKTADTDNITNDLYFGID